jgi:7,8-dihydropterin-6-yl-methyl-4-(beta-D-ribofuranosyl)aminobenzene 5'-phosphate synthase
MKMNSILLIIPILWASLFTNNKEHIMSNQNLQTDKSQQDFMDVHLTVAYDNNPLVPNLQTDWGFSCVVEVGETTLLFDTGSDGALLLRNMDKLKINPERIDLVIISHDHQDHLGGLDEFLEVNSALSIYVPKSFPKEVIQNIRYHESEPVLIDSVEELRPNIFTLGEFGGGIPEQALAALTSKGLVVITGCAHPGILTILERAKKELPYIPIYFVIGGFHLGGQDVSRVSKIVEAFQEMGVQKVAPCHCSGETARSLFQKAYGENFVEMGVGGVFNITNLQK